MKTFDSGDSNRDLHMLETVKDALPPALTVCSRFAPRLAANGELSVDLEIGLAPVPCPWTPATAGISPDYFARRTIKKLTLRLLLPTFGL